MLRYVQEAKLQKIPKDDLNMLEKNNNRGRDSKGNKELGGKELSGARQLLNSIL